jgi:hypothetical protein
MDSTFSNQTFPLVKLTQQSGTTKTINKQDYEGINSNTFSFLLILNFFLLNELGVDL